MTITLYTALTTLLLLTLTWLKTKNPSLTKSWTLTTLLLLTLFLVALAPGDDSWQLPTEVTAFLMVLVGGLGGSVPAAYFVSLLKPSPVDSVPQEK